MQFQVLNINTLPIKYSDNFYSELISKYTIEYMKYAFVNGFIVGSVCARLEPLDNVVLTEEIVANNTKMDEKSGEDCKLYIMGNY